MAEGAPVGRLKPKGGWFPAPNVLVDYWLPFIGMQSFALIMVLIKQQEWEDFTGIIKEHNQEELGRMCGGVSDRYVRTLLKPLDQYRLITKVRRRGVMMYRISDDLLADLKRETGVPVRNVRTVKGPVLGDAPRPFKTGTGVPVSTQDRNRSSGVDRNRSSAKTGTGVPVHKDIRNKKYKTGNQESTSTSLSASISQQNRNISSSEHLDRQKIAEYLRGWIPGLGPSEEGVVDSHALEQLIAGCLTEDPEASTEEITHFIAQKGMALYRKVPNDMGHKLEPRPDIYSPMGFLRQAIVQCFAGEHSAARQYRATRKSKAVNE